MSSSYTVSYYTSPTAKPEEPTYFTVFFSIADLIEQSDINHINILFAIAVQIMAKADVEEINIDPGKKQAFFDWFKEKTFVEEYKAGLEAEVGFDLFGFINWTVRSSRKINEFTRVPAPNAPQLPSGLTITERLSTQGF